MTQNDSEPAGPVNYVFVDFENVCEVDTAILDNKNVELVLLVGAERKTLNVGLVEKLLLHARSVQLVRLDSKGKNALDFTLAYYLGRSTTSSPNGFFHIISKDKGFDPLVEHLRAKHVRVKRHESFAGLNLLNRPGPPAVASAIPSKAPPSSRMPSLTIDAMCTQVLVYLRRAPGNRPKTRKTLVSYVVAQLGNGARQPEAEKVVESLCQAGRVGIDGKGAVTYWLQEN